MTEHEGRYLGGGHRRGGRGDSDGDASKRHTDVTKKSGATADPDTSKALGNRAERPHHPDGWGTNRSERDM